MTGPTVPGCDVERITASPDREGHLLGDDQAAALAADRSLGPRRRCAGWPGWARQDHRHGGAAPGVGEASTARARSSASLRRRSPPKSSADDLGIETENTAKWWQNHLSPGHHVRGRVSSSSSMRRPWPARSRSIASPLSRPSAGAKVLLVGDYGAAPIGRSRAVRSRCSSTTATTLPNWWTCTASSNVWEKVASLDLRHGRTEVIDTYAGHDRISRRRRRGDDRCRLHCLACRSASPGGRRCWSPDSTIP